MPYSSLIITAGISALAPRNSIGKALRRQNAPVVFPPGKQNPEPLDTDLSTGDVERQCLAHLAACPPEPFDPGAVSAEFSLLHQLERAGRLARGALVFLVHTPTLGGRLAVALQKPFLEEVPFDPSQPGGLALASGAFIGTISALLKNAGPRSTAFAPIGGYKVMVALGHTAASFHGFPSLYLHEDSQVLQEIAPAPVTIPPATRELLEPVARRVGNGEVWDKLSRDEQQTIQAHPSFFSRVDDLVELNELGQFLRLDSLPILLSPTAYSEYQKAPGIVGGQVRQIATQAATNPEHVGINHDLTTNKGRHHPWRLARMGEGIRIGWQLTSEALLIGRIWRDHAQYVDEAPRWVTTPLPDSTAKYHPL